MGSDLESNVERTVDTFLQSVVETLQLFEGSVSLTEILSMPVCMYRDLVSKYLDLKKKIARESGG